IARIADVPDLYVERQLAPDLLLAICGIQRIRSSPRRTGWQSTDPCWEYMLFRHRAPALAKRALSCHRILRVLGGRQRWLLPRVKSRRRRSEGGGLVGTALFVRGRLPSAPSLRRPRSRARARATTRSRSRARARRGGRGATWPARRGDHARPP